MASNHYEKNLGHRGLTNSATNTAYAKTLIPFTAAQKTGSGAGAINYPSGVDVVSAGSNYIFDHCGGLELEIQVFGTNADNEACQLQIALWTRIAARDGQDPQGTEFTDTLDLWVPYLVGRFDCTYDATSVGLALSPVPALNYFADTITEDGTSWDDQLVTVISRADDLTPALIRIGTIGFHMFSIDFDTDATSGTTSATGNVVWRIL